MCELLNHLGIAVDGGKDSLSMAAKVRKEDNSFEVVKAPGTLVISTYASVPDINVKVTPLMKGNGKIVYLNLSGSNCKRLGGSALAQAFAQVGDQCPNLDNPSFIKAGFECVQRLINLGYCTAGHYISDGGLITCLLEMAFASKCGLKIDLHLSKNENIFNSLFCEECGVIIEISNDHLLKSLLILKSKGLVPQIIGEANFENDFIYIESNKQQIINVCYIFSYLC